MKIITLGKEKIRVFDSNGKKVVAGPDLGRLLKLSRINDCTSKFCEQGKEAWVEPVMAFSGQRIWTTVITKEGVLKILNSTCKEGIKEEKELVRKELIPHLEKYGREEIKELQKLNEELKEKNKKLNQRVVELRNRAYNSERKLEEIEKAINKIY